MDETTREQIRDEVERAGNSGAVRATGNPFLLPEASTIFGSRQLDKVRRNAERAALMQMSLINRAKLQRPSVPPCVLHRSHAPESALAPLVPSNSSEMRAARSRRMTEFLHEKREIFLLQLIIDRQRAEIRKIHESMANEEHSLVEEEADIVLKGKEYKRHEVELEANLSEFVRRAEMATQKRVELYTRLKRATAGVISTKSEIERNLEVLEDFRQYAAFLKMMTPENFLTAEYFDTPSKMIESLDDLEKQNLLLIQTRQFFNEKTERQNLTIVQAQDDSFAEIERFEQELRDLPAPAEAPTGLSAEMLEQGRQLDEEYEHVAHIVRRSYRACFHRDSELSCLQMLTWLETRLEDLATKLEGVDPAFVAQKQGEQEKKRREQHRIRKQIRQEEEQKMKMEQALARATRPIQKRAGRPLIARTLPRKAQAGVDYAQIAAAIEQQRIDALLYGEFV